MITVSLWVYDLLLGLLLLSSIANIIMFFICRSYRRQLEVEYISQL